MKVFVAVLSVFAWMITDAQSLREEINKGTTILCAHRGGMYDDYAENSLRTLEFLERSFGGKPVMAEVDIRKSKDGTLFLMHDNTVDRTTNGSGKVEDLSDTYLRSLKLKNRKGQLLEESIPTFDELLDFVAKRKIYLMLDVKIDDWKQILDLVSSKEATSKCLVLTFKAENSKIVHELSPNILVSCLVRDQKDWNEIRKIVSHNVLLAYISNKTPDDVMKSMKKQNVALVTDASEATANNFKPYSGEHYRSVISRGVNIYVTDLPIEVSAVLN
jgi:glycerophosphoryl diester phosphodiesterase